MDITVLIPCRAGSTRVLNKNFRPFSDSSLFEIKLNQAKKYLNNDFYFGDAKNDQLFGFIKRLSRTQITLNLNSHTSVLSD